jgi:DNA-binding MarR family transcriptional regulator
VYRLAIDEGMAQSQLAEALCVDASTVTKTLGRLERDGVIERRGDATDARISRVYLTTRGRTLLKPVLDVWKEAENRLVRGMTKSEQSQLRRLLLQVSANLSS